MVPRCESTVVCIAINRNYKWQNGECNIFIEKDFACTCTIYCNGYCGTVKKDIYSSLYIIMPHLQNSARIITRNRTFMHACTSCSTFANYIIYVQLVAERYV